MKDRNRIMIGVAALGAVIAIVGVWIVPSLAAGPPAAANVLFVSNTSASGLTGPGALPGGPPGKVSSSLPTQIPPPQLVSGCANPAYTTIGAAVAAATAGQTIAVCPGVYDEDVVVSKQLTIEGVGGPIVDAQNLTNGVQVTASGSTIAGLTVSYAIGEGILVGGSAPVSNVTITGNTVTSNDQGNPTGEALGQGDLPASPYGECNASLAGPGDCGEGIHLLSAVNSTVTGNVVTANLGGILLTDENGPTDGNLIADNDVENNAYDCGITIASHRPAATGAGVYDNTVRDNKAIGNGVMAQGGGVLLATGVPGGAVYDNTVEGNFLSGNGLAGVTVHAHMAGENLNGNTIENNTIGTNNLDGDPDFGPDFGSGTTGVIVATGPSPISITVTGNQISFDQIGIATTSNVTLTSGPPANTFVGVTTQIQN